MTRLHGATPLLATAEALVQAFEAGDSAALLRALAQRESEFGRLRERAAQDRLTDAERRALAQLAEIDRALLAAARPGLARVREQLAELRRIRAGIRRLGSGSGAARFVSRQV